MGNEARGSELLRARYTEDDLNELLKAAEDAGAQLQNFFPLGVPAFDGASGTWRVEPQHLAAVIDALIKVRSVPDLQIIVNGLPAIDAVNVGFQVGYRRLG